MSDEENLSSKDMKDRLTKAYRGVLFTAAGEDRPKRKEEDENTRTKSRRAN